MGGILADVIGDALVLMVIVGVIAFAAGYWLGRRGW